VNRSTMLRLARLEAKRREEPIILHFAHPNSSCAIHGTAKHFFRLINELKREFLHDGLAYRELHLLAMSENIEGNNAQLFALARALAQGPVDTPTPIVSE
jgi:hypothetical protein